MSGRAQAVLGRFPAHLDAPRAGKQLERVVEGLVAPLDLLSAELAAVRRSHRLPHADTLRDVLRIGALHGLSAGELALLFRRAERTRELAAALEAAVGDGDAEARDAAAGALRELWGIQPVPEGVAPLAPFASPAATPDLDEAGRRAARAFRAAAGFRATVEGARRRVERVSRLHAAGNGTVRAVLEGAAAALDLELDVARNVAAKEDARPDVTVKPAGAPGQTLWGYVVIARSLTRSDPAVSLPAFTAKGPAELTAEEPVRVSWAPVPDVLDYLVFRVHAGGAPASTGLLTPEPLPADATWLDDTGRAAGVPLPPPQNDDGIFHSRDLFWHSTYVHDRVRPVRRLDPEPPSQAVAIAVDAGLDELAEGMDVPFATLLARLP
ncbi:MAG TPA: hypothetical protein VFQ45_01005, partial [Longimicrobium sp.]|nr:hypothetical protein [Longimicrobium sp.]